MKLKSKNLEKIFALKIAEKKFKNWYIFPLIYLKIYFHSFANLITKNNIIIKIRTDSTDFFTFVNIWLLDEYFKNKINIQKNDIIIDIGGHIGLFALYASQYCKNGKIYSFEPVIENYNLFLENIKNNNLTNVKAFNTAVSKNEGEVNLFLNDDQAAHSIFTKSNTVKKVNSTTLQKIFEKNKIENCNLLKIDCEGAEYEILENLPIEYYKKIQKIVIECHFVETKKDVFEKLRVFLNKQNFKIDEKKLDNELIILLGEKIDGGQNSRK